MPAPRHDPVTRIGAAMHGHARRSPNVEPAEAVRPTGEEGDGPRALGRDHPCAEMHDGRALGRAGARPAAAWADRHLELHGRLEAVDIRSVEEARLDLAHGRARIATRPPAEPVPAPRLPA